MSERTNLEAQKARLTAKLGRTPAGTASAKNTTYYLAEVEKALATLPVEVAVAPGESTAPAPAAETA